MSAMPIKKNFFAFLCLFFLSLFPLLTSTPLPSFTLSRVLVSPVFSSSGKHPHPSYSFTYPSQSHPIIPYSPKNRPTFKSEHMLPFSSTLLRSTTHLVTCSLQMWKIKFLPPALRLVLRRLRLCGMPFHESWRSHQPLLLLLPSGEGAGVNLGGFS